MIRSYLRPLAAALLVLSAAPVLAEDEMLSTEDQATITAMLTEMGYEVRKVEYDDGKLEAYAVKDGENYEIVLKKTDAGFEIEEIES